MYANDPRLAVCSRYFAGLLFRRLSSRSRPKNRRALGIVPAVRFASLDPRKVKTLAQSFLDYLEDLLSPQRD